LLELLEDHGELLRATLRYLCERLLYEIQDLEADALQSLLDGEDVAVPEDRPLDRVERLVYLRSLGPFKRANLNALAMMAQQLAEVRLAPGEPVWSAGDPADDNFFVLSGR